MSKNMECCICKGEIDKITLPNSDQVVWDQGHNALPVMEGRCCTKCNWEVVLEERLKDIDF